MKQKRTKQLGYPSKIYKVQWVKIPKNLAEKKCEKLRTPVIQTRARPYLEKHLRREPKNH
jgi:hypothetical protein